MSVTLSIQGHCIIAHTIIFLNTTTYYDDSVLFTIILRLLILSSPSNVHFSFYSVGTDISYRLLCMAMPLII